MRSILLGSAAAVVLFGVTDARAESVNIGMPNWTGAQAIAHLLHQVVTSKIGGEAEIVTGTNATIFQAMDAGKGDIDVHPDVWLPNQESFTKEYVDGKGTVVLNENPYVGASRASASARPSPRPTMSPRSSTSPGRRSLRPWMVTATARATIWIGAPGWASANVNEVKVRDYGLMPFMEPVRAEQSVMVAEVGDSHRQGRGLRLLLLQAACHLVHARHGVMLEEPAVRPREVQDDPAGSGCRLVREVLRDASKDALKNVQIAYSKIARSSARRRSPSFSPEHRSSMPKTVSGFAFEIAGNGRDPAEVTAEGVGRGQ